MKIKSLPLYALIALALASCGVKGPPIAPQSRPETRALILDCSPYSEKCDERDPKYVSGLDPKNPKDAKRIRELEEASARRRKAKTN